MLAGDGFEVVLLAPKDSLAAKSRYVWRTGVLATTATPMEWLLELIRLIDEHEPEALVPCDEMGVRLLITVALEPPPGFRQALMTRLVKLVEASLGDPRFYGASIDKTMLPAAAEGMSMRVPDYALATSVDDARRHATTLGERSANAHLLEINRRLVTYMHLGERVGRDLASAFFARLESPQRARPTDEREHASVVIAVFPREWLRDPHSPNLVNFPVDVPWDDPALLEAMLAMRHEH